jgi:hypothetical protein
VCQTERTPLNSIFSQKMATWSEAFYLLQGPTYATSYSVLPVITLEHQFHQFLTGHQYSDTAMLPSDTGQTRQSSDEHRRTDYGARRENDRSFPWTFPVSWVYPLVMTNSSPWYRWPIEIDDVAINSMMDLSMAMLTKVY